MDRFYEEPTIFVDDTEPSINAENLNKITNGLANVDKRVAEELLTTSLAVTETGEKALDAAAGKALNDRITTLDSNLTTTKNSLSLVQLWTGNVSTANTVITLNASIDNYKTLYFQFGSPVVGSTELGWYSTTIRRWYEGGWAYSETGRIAIPTAKGYVQLEMTSATQITLLHADNALRTIHGTIN